MVTQKSGVDIIVVNRGAGGHGLVVRTSIITEPQHLPDSRADARDPRDAAVADDWCWGAEAEGEGHAVEAETEQRSRRRARQSIRENPLIWLLQQRLHAVSWPHWRLRCMQQLLGLGTGVFRP